MSAPLSPSLSYSLSPSLSLCPPPSPLLVRVRRINSCMAKYANKVAELLATSTTARSRPHTRRCGGGAKAETGRGLEGSKGYLKAGALQFALASKWLRFCASVCGCECVCVWLLSLPLSLFLSPSLSRCRSPALCVRLFASFFVLIRN